ncbi:MAG: hypothetical protein IK092_02210 [Muribaculaceae bacterium]|nr:hypothetical protein [Muribaculaceae bacterium]
MKTKHLILLLAMIFTPLVACSSSNGEKKVETQANATDNNILPLDLGFLEKVGVDVSKVGDICDIKDYADLNEEQVIKLLPMLSRMNQDELIRDYYIKGARALSGGLTMLLYSAETGDDSTTELLAIYDKDGNLTDYMQLDDWDQFEPFDFDDEFTKGKAHVTDTKIIFTSPSEFTLDETVKESSWERKDDDTPILRCLTDQKWLVETVKRYSVDKEGHMALVEDKVVKSEGDVDPDFKNDPIWKLYKLPAFDPSRIDLFNNLANDYIKKEGRQAFDDDNNYVTEVIVGECFAGNPEALLNWIYKNRDKKTVVADYLKRLFTSGTLDKSVIDQEIGKLADKNVKNYLKALTANWRYIDE